MYVGVGVPVVQQHVCVCVCVEVGGQLGEIGFSSYVASIYILIRLDRDVHGSGTPWGTLN